MKTISCLTSATTRSGSGIKRVAVPLAKALGLAVVLAWCLGTRTVAQAQNCIPNDSQIALFQQINYGGACVVKGIGEHPIIQLSEKGSRPLQNVQFFSIRVGTNVEALACAKPNLNGQCVLLYRDTASFSGREINSAASFIVRRKNQPPECRPNANQVGFWGREYFFGPCWLQDIGVVSGMGYMNIRSLTVGENVEVLLCNEQNFGGLCVLMTSGPHDRLSLLRDSTSGSIAVRRRNQAPACEPANNQVALFEYGRFIGRCKLLGIGRYSADEALGWSNFWISSLKVGANVKLLTCSPTRDRQPPACGAHGTDLHVDLRVVRDVSIVVARRDEIGSSAGRDDPTGRSFTVMLAPHAPYGAQPGDPPQYPWWTGRYPTIGRLDGNLTRVANPRNSYWLGFLKPGYNNPQDDCGDSNNYVRLNPGETMTADQLNTIFGSQTPDLPVQFVVCSNAQGQRNAEGGLNFPGLPLNITYTRRR